MNRIKVLLIDDEEEFCKALKLGLELTKEFDVLTATTGTAGLDLARKTKPDVILLDIVMPDVTGTEVAERLREEGATRHIPIMFLTALLRKDEEQKVDRSPGEYRIVAKPVDLDYLVAQIGNMVREQSARTDGR
jgi:DNA-binding response OmpR family regulator